MKKLFLSLLFLVSVPVSCLAISLTWRPCQDLTLSLPFNSLSVDYLININKDALIYTSKDQAGNTITQNVPQFLGGLRTPLITFYDFSGNIGSISDTGYNWRAYYSISYDYTIQNPNLVLLNEIIVSVFWSGLFDGKPNIYGIALSKRLWS